MENQSSVQAKEIQLQAVIIRANGSREDLGVISYWNSSVLKRIIWRIKQWLH